MNKFRIDSDGLFERKEEDLELLPDKIVFLSVEGNDTEYDYFNLIQKHREELGINSMVHLHVLHRSKKDTYSSVDAVLALLEDFVILKQNNELPQSLRNSIPNKYNDEFIKSYLKGLPVDEELKPEFEDDLKLAGIDYEYNIFLNKYKGKKGNDVFGVIMDRDWQCHTTDQLKRVLKTCNEKKYLFFLSNPCFEFWLLLHLSDVKKEYDTQFDKILFNDHVSNKHTFISKEVSNKAGHSKKINENVFVEKYMPYIDLASQRAQNDFSTNLSELIGTEKKGDIDEKGKIGTNIYELIDILKR